ncbi:hypothetical protein [Pseudomonas sp. Ant30-3]|uniref:hypothetical protein n=1 Tax=Pseudomonas sp. Ant30-3 TaxID=1488328 RepID=UPI00048E7A53|nr:hypothetical protein [Pseudomonas sp. Ant30-3]
MSQFVKECESECQADKVKSHHLLHTAQTRAISGRQWDVLGPFDVGGGVCRPERNGSGNTLLEVELELAPPMIGLQRDFERNASACGEDQRWSVNLDRALGGKAQ